MELKKEAKQFIRKKRKWLKALEVMRDLIKLTKDYATTTEEKIFEYQSVLNMLQKGEQRPEMYLNSMFTLVEKF